MGSHERSAHSRRSKRLKDMASQKLPDYNPAVDLESQGTQHSPMEEPKSEDCFLDTLSPSLTKMVPKRKRREKFGEEGARAGLSDASDATAAKIQHQSLPETAVNKRPAKRSCSEHGVIDLMSDEEHDQTLTEIKKERCQTPSPSGGSTLPSDHPPTKDPECCAGLHEDTKLSLRKYDARISELEVKVHQLCETYDKAVGAKDVSDRVHGASQPRPSGKQVNVADSVKDFIGNMDISQPTNDTMTKSVPNKPATAHPTSVQTQGVEDSFGQVNEARKNFTAMMQKISDDQCVSATEKEDFRLRWEDKLRRLLRKHRLEILDLAGDAKADMSKDSQKTAEEREIPQSRESCLSHQSVVLDCDEEERAGVVAAGDEARNAPEQQSSPAIGDSEKQRSEDRSENPSEYLSFEE